MQINSQDQNKPLIGQQSKDSKVVEVNKIISKSLRLDVDRIENSGCSGYIIEQLELQGRLVQYFQDPKDKSIEEETENDEPIT